MGEGGNMLKDPPSPNLAEHFEKYAADGRKILGPFFKYLATKKFEKIYRFLTVLTVFNRFFNGFQKFHNEK